MSQPWPDPHAAIQHLLIWLDRESVLSHNIAGTASAQRDEAPESFVPQARIETYFRDNNGYRRSRNLLEACGQQGVSPRDLAENCCRVFCILARLGKTPLISVFVRHPDLWDDRLPFDVNSPPKNFPRDTTDAILFSRFCTEQQHFCAYAIRQSHGLFLTDERILPITSLRKVGGGASSTVYHASIHESYDLIQPPSPTHCYAIKTFRRRNAEDSYHKEGDAFQRVTEAGLRSARGIIGFHGSFEYRGTFNLVLEYADGGTLEDYFRKNEPPRSGDQIIQFWASLFETIKGVFRIHEHHLPPNGQQRGLVLHGWHQDLKPTNILVVSSASRSLYDCSFKVADLGLAHFKTIMEGEQEGADRDTFGTRTYGAPECYAPSSYTENRVNLIKRSSDIWSLGCIFSEAVVWLANGRDGLHHYRQARKSANDSLPDFRGGDCFHDGERRLAVVDAWHKNLRPNLHPADYITGPVLDWMVTDMLEVNPDLRPSAQQLDGKADRCIARARELLQSAPVPQTPQRPSGGAELSPPDTPPTPTPASGPRDRNSSANGFPGRVLREDDRYMQSPRTTLREPNELPGGPIIGPPSGPIGDLVSRQSPPLAGPSRFNQSRHSTITNQMARNHHLDPDVPRGLETFGALSINTPPRESLSPEEATSPATGRPDGHGDSRSPANHAGLVCCPRCSNLVSEELMNSHSNICLPNTQPHSQASKRVPHLSVAETRKWYEKRKSGNKSAPLPDDWLMKSLNDRDYVFMIDDAASMRPLWDDVVGLAQLLTYIIKDKDPDGFELFFLGGGKGLKLKRSADMVNAVRGHRLSGMTNLDTCLGDHLHEYSRLVENYANPNARRWSIRAKPTPPRKKNIYIFTDGELGIGGDDQAHYAIKTLTEKLVAASLSREHVGIQFIQFGDSQKGRDRLARLDQLNKLSGLQLDIADTEPSDGNVWKMLLGAINELFDGD